MKMMMTKAREIEKYCNVEIHFVQQIPDNRQLSVWYSGELVHIKHGSYSLCIYTDGSVSMKSFKRDYNGDSGDKVKTFFLKMTHRNPEDSELLAKIHEGELQIDVNKLLIRIKNSTTNKITIYPVSTKNIFKAVNEAYMLLERLSKF